jgi:hypothetical protein
VEHPGNTFWEHSVNIQGTFREHAVNMQGTMEKKGEKTPNKSKRVSGIQGTSREHPGNIQGTFREHAGNTFRERAVNMQ